jgi:acyl-CoA synthetase (AMP-forming)/AMP-acid ligase II
MKAPTTLVEAIEAAPGDRIAIVSPETGAAISYASLRRQVAEVAASLRAGGVGPQDRVALALPNGPATIVTFLGASLAGVAAPLNPAYRYEEFLFYLDDTSARVLVIPPEGADEARQAARERGIPVLAAETDSSGVTRLAGPPGPPVDFAPDPERVALVLHTSGSTGRPKRVPLTHFNLAVSIENIVQTYKLSPNDVSLCLMPLFHVHGLLASLLSTFRSGGTVVVPAKFNPLSFWRTVRDHRVTWYSAVPTIHQLLLARLGPERPAGAEQLRFIRSCSAALPPEVARQLEDRIGAPVLEAYGMTEASHQMASNPLPPAERKFGTVGCGTGVRISILDDQGNHLPAGQLGEVVIQGPNVIRGYENNPEANATSFVGGWFRTGDQGVLDAQGYLRLTGRIKELINRGGEKISPREIDEALLGHPAVAEAVAFGVPHPTWGEEVNAAVVLREPATEADLISYCRSRLADFKRPKKIHVVETIPRTATGKIQRGNVAKTLAGAEP